MIGSISAALSFLVRVPPREQRLVIELYSWRTYKPTWWYSRPQNVIGTLLDWVAGNTGSEHRRFRDSSHLNQNYVLILCYQSRQMRVRSVRAKTIAIQDKLKNPQYVCSDWLQRVAHSLNLSRQAKPKQTLLSFKRKRNSFSGPFPSFGEEGLGNEVYETLCKNANNVATMAHDWPAGKQSHEKY